MVFDTETEHLNLRTSRPWQLAYLIIKNGKILDQGNLFPFWEDLSISKKAAQITRFNYNDYKRKSIDKREAWDVMAPYFFDEDIKLVGHNILGFDVFQMRTWGREMGIEPKWPSFLDRCIDTLALARAIHLDRCIDKDNFITWQYKMLSIRQRGMKTGLGALGKHYEVSHNEDGLHDALADIKLNASIFSKQIFEIEI